MWPNVNFLAIFRNTFSFLLNEILVLVVQETRSIKD